MSRDEKLLLRVLSGGSDANIDFDQLRRLLQRLGFAERVWGSHHISVSPALRASFGVGPKQITDSMRLVMNWTPDSGP